MLRVALLSGGEAGATWRDVLSRVASDEAPRATRQLWPLLAGALDRLDGDGSIDGANETRPLTLPSPRRGEGD